MSILKLAWASCVLAALSLSTAGCMMDATGSGDDGPLGEDALQLGERTTPPPDDPSLVDDADDPIDPPLLGAEQSEQAPMPGELVTDDDDPNEPHPDPWRVAPPSAPAPGHDL